jgi:acetyl-CoA carboxylase biotin carboxyl carrier protein
VSVIAANRPNKRRGEPVADDTSKIPSPFDVRTIKDLVLLMSRHDLSEIDLREGDLRIRLRRGPQGVTVAGGAVTTLLPASTPAAAVPSSTDTRPPADEQARQSKTAHEIKSPTPGTFYASSSPDVEPFVKIGSKVTPDTVVCLIEAMKIFNEITADCTGTVAEICVNNQQPVEFGQVLFRVEPGG